MAKEEKRDCDTCVHEDDSGDEYCGSCDLVSQYTERAEFASDRTYERMKQLEAKLDALRWIPVSEGLPEKDSTLYELFVPSFNKNFPQFGYYYGKGIWFTFVKSMRRTKLVTHYRKVILPESKEKKK